MLIDPGSTQPRTQPDRWTDPTVRMDEGVFDPQGRFYCGSMAYGAALGRGAALYCLDRDSACTRSRTSGRPRRVQPRTPTADAVVVSRVLISLLHAALPPVSWKVLAPVPH